MLQKTKGQYSSKIGVKLSQSEVHSLRVLWVWSRIGFDGCFWAERLLQNCLAAISRPVLAHDSAVGDGIKPNAETLGLAQGAEATKGFDPSLLQDIPGVLVTLNQPPDVIKQPPLEGPHDFIESFFVTALGSDSQQFLIEVLSIFVFGRRFHRVILLL